MLPMRHPAPGSIAARRGREKELSDRLDLHRLLRVFPGLRSDEGEVAERLRALGAEGQRPRSDARSLMSTSSLTRTTSIERSGRTGRAGLDCATCS